MSDRLLFIFQFYLRLTNKLIKMDTDNPATENGQQMLPSSKKKKKCHGNRKDQRFRKKWRARNMSSGKIEKLLAKRKQTDRSNADATTVTNVQKLTTAMPRANLKRKVPASHSTAILQSTSSVSMRQSVPKKIKKSKSRKDPVITKFGTVGTVSEHRDLINVHHYRHPMYLKRSSYMLFEMLQKTFRQPIEIKSEQKFLHLRLNLLDQHYFLEVHLHLWKSYLRIGLDEQQHQ